MENEFEVKEILEKERKNIKSLDDLMNYIQNIRDNYDIGYDTAPRAIAQAALATSYYLADMFGITGFQAGFVMWDFIKDWSFRGNKCGLKIVNYDDMLYPQYNYKFQKTIKKDKPSRLHARREMLKVLYPVTSVPKQAAGRKQNTVEVDMCETLYSEIAPKYAERNGGYTRIVKIGQRKGDGALEVLLELV